MLFSHPPTHRHTHRHTHTYNIYIYTYRERESCLYIYIYIIIYGCFSAVGGYNRWKNVFLFSEVREALAAKLSRPKTLRFSVGKVPPDGRCFWYSWLASVLSDEWWAIERNKTGYALNREQLLTEENMGQRLLDEVMDKMISIASTDEALASYEDVKDRVASMFLVILTMQDRMSN